MSLRPRTVARSSSPTGTAGSRGRPTQPKTARPVTAATRRPILIGGTGPSDVLPASLRYCGGDGLGVTNHHQIALLDLVEIRNVVADIDRPHVAARAAQRDLALVVIDVLDGRGDLGDPGPDPCRFL